MRRFSVVCGLVPFLLVSCQRYTGSSKQSEEEDTLIPADTLSTIFMDLARADGPDEWDEVAGRLKKYGSYELSWEEGRTEKDGMFMRWGIRNDRQFPGWTMTGKWKHFHDGKETLTVEYSKTIEPAQPTDGRAEINPK